MTNHRTGYAAILGLPNSGKSTLLNVLLGQKLSIITSKPQTTRKRILGILSEEDYQIIFLDTPGILSPSYLLQEKMMEDVKTSLDDADVILLVIDVAEDPLGEILLNQEFISESVLKSSKPKLLVINKVDLSNQEKVTELLKHFEKRKSFEEIIPISAALNFNIQRVKEEIVRFLPEGPKLFPDDQVTDANERFFVSEIIREKILEHYRDEIPYSSEVLIIEFKEREEGKNFISAEIVVERDSQKAIIIGKGGTAIKKLGQAARESIEEFLQKDVFLELRVKVRKKWRSDENLLKSFGYSIRNKT
ncbi:MAG: GTPase Era [Ignavibacteriota bacterium]|nr:MAG: GTPase Era [Chlorobiota bacterium]MBE7476821.1 GTPase Era [Ignavibacteriales bacterium]MBL1121927.1 GTPase Era [Ignavibacteriota bacterium]MCC7092932.1 GTPase Era [Ignavibacteriaceae bacterium]MCE7855586.1 GTPase Era [Ignavibacteria bacterium CHB3]MEB2296001.1 GTPase Era [Ignavibacteria bacterium]